MADDDAWQEDAENVDEGGQAREEEKSKSKRHEEAGEEKTEAQLLIEAKQRKHEEEEAARLRELEEQRRIEREKEEDELRRLKEKQAQRKKEREEEERKLEIQRQEAEEQRKREEQRRQEKELEKQRKQEEAERKKAAAAAAMVGGRNFTINKEQGESSMEKFMNISKAKTEMGLNANELEVLKRRTVEDRVKPLSVSDLDFKGLQRKAEELWKQIVQLETAKYDLAERAKRQEYDLKELNERQRQINQKKYAAQGLDVEQNTRHPPKVQIISKYERRTDRRTFGDRKGLFDGSQIKDDKPELNKPKGVRRDNWIKAKETEEKRGSRQYADEEDESPTYSQPTRHEEEPEQEEVAAEDEE